MGEGLGGDEMSLDTIGEPIEFTFGQDTGLRLGKDDKLEIRIGHWPLGYTVEITNSEGRFPIIPIIGKDGEKIHFSSVREAEDCALRTVENPLILKRFQNTDKL